MPCKGINHPNNLLFCVQAGRRRLERSFWALVLVSSPYQEFWSCLYLKRVAKLADKLLYRRNILSPSPSLLPQCDGQADFFPPSPPAHSLSFPFACLANCGYLPEMEIGITLAGLAGAVGGQCCPGQRGSPPRVVELGECKGGETWPADDRSCSCLFHNAGFLSRKHCSSSSQSLSDLSVSCRKCVEMGSEHPGLLTRHLLSLFMAHLAGGFGPSPVGAEVGREVPRPPLASHPASVSLFGVCTPGPVPVCFTGVGGRLRN